MLAIESAGIIKDEGARHAKSVSHPIINWRRESEAFAAILIADSTNDLITAFTDPQSSPYPHIAPQLAVSLRNQIAPHLEAFPSEALARVSRDLDFKFNQQTSAAAASIGQNYTIQGTADNPTFVLNADGLDAMRRQAAAIDAAYPPQARPTENQYYRNLLAQKAALQTGVSVATDHPSLVDAYIKQHAAVLTPEQQISLMNQATEAIRRPAQMFNARNENLDTSLTQKYLQQVHDGNLDTAGLEDAATHRLISPEHYQQITGYQFMPPGNPSAIAAMQKQIAGTTDENDLETLRGTINGPLNAELYGKGAIPLNAAIENQKRQLTTVEGQQRRQDSDQIKRAFQSIPGGPATTLLYNRFAALNGVPTLPELKANAINDYNAITYGVTDPVKLRAARVKVIQDNAPDLASVGMKPTPAPAASVIPARRPGESLSDYGARARAAGATLPPTDDEARRVTALARARGLLPPTAAVPLPTPTP